MTALTVSTWRHNRKGLITGIEVGKDRGTDSEWMNLVLVGDHDPRRMYGGLLYREIGAADDADVMTVRRSFMTLVSTEEVEVSEDVDTTLAAKPYGEAS